MKKEERTVLYKLRDDVHSIRKDVDWIKNDVAVNGVKGLQSVLTQNHKDIKELRELTAAERANKHLRNALREHIKAHPVRLTITKWVLGLLSSGTLIGIILKLFKLI